MANIAMPLQSKIERLYLLNAAELIPLTWDYYYVHFVS